MNPQVSAPDPIVELAKTRAALQQLLDPAVVKARESVQEPQISEAEPAGHFPRSLTMKLLAGNRGIGPLLMMAFGVIALRPKMAATMLRYVPVGAIAKTLIARFIGNQGARK